MNLGVPGASVVRYDGTPGRRRSSADGARTATLRLPSTSRIDLDGDTVVAKVLRSGSPQRVNATRRRRDDSPRSCGATATRPRWRRRWASAGGCGARSPRGRRSEEPLPEGDEQRLCDFAELVAQALANADAHEQLAASRARIVEAGDAERRRLERNLHDGAQQRLVSVALDLASGRREARAGTRRPRARSCSPRRRTSSPQGLDELRELARGIHPAVLTERGLGPALEALAIARAGARRDRRSCRTSGSRGRSRRPPTTSSPRR